MRCYERRHAMCTSIHPSFRPKRVSDATQDARTASPPTSTLVWDGQREALGGAREEKREKPSAACRAFLLVRVALISKEMHFCWAHGGYLWLLATRPNAVWSETHLLWHSLVSTRHVPPLPISSQYCILSLMRASSEKMNESGNAFNVLTRERLWNWRLCLFWPYRASRISYQMEKLHCIRRARIIFFVICFQKPKKWDA